MNQNKPVTVIITTYQRPKLLKRAVESVLKQTYSFFHIRVYDNASNDETEEIIQKFIKSDTRIKYHKHPENIGMLANYAYAYSEINTPYFAFLSDDDFYYPNFLETAMQGFKEYPKAGFSACGVLQINESGRVCNDPLSQWPRNGCYEVPEGLLTMVSKNGMFPVPTGIIFQTEIIKDITPHWSKEIQLLWDPDYLIQISSRFPIVINKIPCCQFSIHDTGFAISFYNNLIGSVKGFSDLFTAIKLVQERTIQNEDIPKKIRKLAVKLLQKPINTITSDYTKHYINQKQFPEAISIINLYTKNFGMSFYFTILYCWIYTSKLFPSIASLIKSIKNFKK